MTSPSGLGIFLWIWNDCDGGDITKILDRCVQCNISWVALHFPDVTAERVQAFHDENIYVAAWWYCVPGEAETETFIKSAVNMRKLDVDAILPDCEIEWEQRDGKPADRRPEAKIFAEQLRVALGPDIFIGNCGAWAYPDFHPEYPDHAFGHYFDAASPERYWTMFSPKHTPASVLDESDRQWADKMNTGAYKTLIPIGSAFDGVAQGGQALHPEDVAAFLDRQETCALWSWQHLPENVWAMLEARAQAVSPTASTEPPPA